MLFDEEKTKEWLTSFAIASGNLWFVVEPVEVLALVMLPFLLDNSCVANTRQTLKDLGVY